MYVFQRFETIGLILNEIGASLSLFFFLLLFSVTRKNGMSRDNKKTNNRLPYIISPNDSHCVCH